MTRYPFVTRWVAAAVVASTLLAGACSSSADRDDSTATGDGTNAAADTTEPPIGSGQLDATGADSGRSPGFVTLIDAGAEPRVDLHIATDARSRITVDASDALAITIEGVTTDEGADAIYELALDLTVSGTDAVLLAVPTIESIDGPTPAADELGTWRWLLDTHGVVQRVIPVGWSHRIDDATFELLSAADLVLVTPAEPVGPGATWSQSLNRQGGAELVFTLNTVTDTDLDVTVELVAPFDDGAATMMTSGTYDRATLLVRDVTTESSLDITSPVTDNGALVDLSGVQSSRRTYLEEVG